MSGTRAPLAQTLYEKLLALPDNIVGEVIDGVLYTQPWRTRGLVDPTGARNLLCPQHRGHCPSMHAVASPMAG